MSRESNSESEAYDKEYDAFLKQLDEFHQQRGTSFKRLPRINGKGVDLYLLYVVVTARGGWQKVNARNEWDEILEDFRLPAACVNSSVALKQIYMRYLDAYERVTFLGSDGDDKNNDVDDEDSSHPAVRSKKSVRALNVVPLSYNSSVHNVAECVRVSGNLCTDLYRPSQYDRLCLSLCSPLPNEHDFSFNLCTLLSNEGRQVMHLSQCPRLLEIMLGHGGVYKDEYCMNYFVSNIKNQKGKNLVQFWLDSVEKKQVLELLLPPSSCSSLLMPWLGRASLLGSCKRLSGSVESGGGADTCNAVDEGGGSCAHCDNDTESSSCNEGVIGGGAARDPLLKDDSQNDLVYSSVNCKCSSDVNNRNNVNSRSAVSNDCVGDHSDYVLKRSGVNVLSVFENKSKEFAYDERDETFENLKKVLGLEDCLSSPDYTGLFHCGRDSGLQDSEGTRIAQLIHILRNLSFEEDNVNTLAQSKTCLRFLVLCMCSRFNGLAIQALDTLGNISHEVVLREPLVDPTSRLLLCCVCEGVFAEDRARLLRSLEVLNRLAMRDANEEVMAENIKQEVYDQICRYLTVHDIMLLIYTLESLYSLSSLGSASCNAIVRAQGSIHTLVALLTVEAQSYGPEACIGMKVVETVTGVVSDHEATSTGQQTLSSNTSASVTAFPNATTTSTPGSHSVLHHNPPTTTHTPPILSSTISTPTLAAANAAALHNTNSNNINNGMNKMPPKNVMDMKKSVMSSAIPSEVEEFVCDWIRRCYETVPGNLLEQAVVFRHFSSAMHALGKKQGFNPVMLSSCFRKVYGFKVGPTRHNPKDATDKWYYHDLKRRDTPLPVKPGSGIFNNINKNKVLNSPLTHTPVLPRVDPPSSAGPGSSILKAQLSAPLRPISPAAPRILPQQPGGMPAGGPQVSPISSSPPPYSPNCLSSPRPQHTQSSSPSPFTPPPPSCTPPPSPRQQENTALIKSLLANKVTADGIDNSSGGVLPVGGLAGMLAAPIAPAVVPSPSSPFTSSSNQLMQQTHNQNSNPSLLPPPPSYQEHQHNKQQQLLPSIPVPTILKESPPPPMPCVISNNTPQNQQQHNYSGRSLPSLARQLLQKTTEDQVSRNLQKQQQQQLANEANNSVGVTDANGNPMRGLPTTSVPSGNEVLINGEPMKFEDDSSSSLASGVTLDVRKVTSFEGILQNGITDPITTVVVTQHNANNIVSNATVDSNSVQPQATSSSVVKKNVLADLLERTVGGDILNGVVEKEIRMTENNRLPNGPVILNSNNSSIIGNNCSSLTSGGGIKRSGSEAYDESGTKRLAIDRGDGKITLYVTQNGDGDNSNMIPTQQVVIAASTTPVAGTRQLVTSQGQLISPSTQLVTSSGQLVTSTTQIITAGGQLITSGGQLLASGGQQLVTSCGQLVSASGQLVGGGGQLITTPGGQKVVVQGNFGQVLSSGGNGAPHHQVVLSQGGQHIVVGGGAGGDTVLVGGQIITTTQGTATANQGAQIVGQPTQIITASGQIVNQQPQLVGQGQIITASGQGQLLTQGQGHFVSHGGQPQVVTTGQGQLMTQGQSQIISAGQIVNSNQGQIIGQGQLIAQIPGQLNQSQIITQGDILSQGQAQLNQVHQGQIFSHAQGQILSPGQNHVITQNQIIQQSQQGQIISPGSGQLISQGQIISGQGQIFTQGQQSQIVTHGQNQLISQSQGLITQNQGQIIPQGKLVTQGQGQIITQRSNQIVSQNNSQIISHGGQLLGQSGQLVTQGGQLLTQSGQLVTQGSQLVGQGSTLLVQQSTANGGKTLIILPAGQKMVPQQQPGAQMVQVLNSGGAASGGVVKTLAANTGVATIITSTNSSVLAPHMVGSASVPPASSQQFHGAVVVSHQQQHQQTNSTPVIVSTSTSHQVSVNNPSVIVPPTIPHVPAPQILASGIIRRHPPSSSSTTSSGIGVHSIPPRPGGLQYLCEWRGCNCVFSTPQQVYHHVCKVHCPPHLYEVQCLWAGCDPMLRKRFSAMTHLHDRHCNEHLLNVLAVRRQQIATSGKTDIPVPHTPPPHPGYAPNAAFHAIKRHALEVITQRDAVEKEGPVTKSIRLTSALILRNLVIYSNSGRKLLRGYESELCNVAISTLESSRTVAQILHDIHLTDQ